MAPQHEPRERHGSHPLTEYREPEERPHGERMMEDLEMEHPPASRTLSWGDVKEAVYVVGGMVGFLLTGCATYYGVVGEIRDSRKDIESLTNRVVIIERGRAENLPRLEEALRANGLQDQRLQNLTEANSRTAISVSDLARSLSLMSDKVGDMRENMGRLEERIGRGLPHDR